MELINTVKLYQVLGVLILATFAVAINFGDCGSKEAKVTSVNVSPCESDPCVIIPGDTYLMKVIFTPYVNSTKVIAGATVILRGKAHTLPPRNACRYMTCPVIKGQQNSLAFKLRTSPEFTSNKLQLMVYTVDENGNSLFCIDLLFEVKVERNMQTSYSLSNSYLSNLVTKMRELELVQIHHVLDYNSTVQ